MPARVVHCKKAPYDIYIGRGRDPQTGEWPTTSWGNPWVVGVDGTRDDVVRKYRDHIFAHPGIVDLIKAGLCDKVLGCWCAPKPCHGDILAAIANGEPW